MEPETELDQLIADQQADDTNIIRPEFREQVPLTEGITERLGVAGDEIVSFLPRPPKGSLLIGTATWHGTDGGYTRNACRCRPCKDAHATAVRKYRERKKNGVA